MAHTTGRHVELIDEVEDTCDGPRLQEMPPQWRGEGKTGSWRVRLFDKCANEPEPERGAATDLRCSTEWQDKQQSGYRAVTRQIRRDIPPTIYILFNYSTLVWNQAQFVFCDALRGSPILWFGPGIYFDLKSKVF
jgi:hypothetical protein